MAIVKPWYAENESIYHNNSDCKVGNSIANGIIIFGRSGKPLCSDCYRLGRRLKKSLVLNVALP